MRQYVSVFPLYAKDQQEVSNFVSVNDAIDETAGSRIYQREDQESESLMSGHTTLEDFLSENGSRYGKPFQQSSSSGGSSDDKSSEHSSEDSVVHFLSSLDNR